MEKNLINEDMNYLMQTLTDIVKSAPDVIRSSTGRINELEKYLFTWSLMSDKYSHDLYGRLLQRMLAVECLDDISAAKKFPIWDNSFREQYEIKRKTVVLPDLCHPDDRASQIIFPETFLMPAYNYHDFCCVEKGDVVFDIGAWIGDTSCVFSERLGG